MGNNKLAIGFTAVAIIGVGAGAAVLAMNSQKNATSNTNDVQTTSTPTPTTSSSTGTTVTPTSSGSTVSIYKDGRYSAEGQYFSPGGLQKIVVNLTVKDGTVSDLALTEKSSDRESKQYQQKFISGVNSLVIGKKLDDVSVGKVSGSSLTSQGFNDALSKVKTQAKQS